MKKNYILKKLKNEKKNHIKSYRTHKYKMEYDNAIHMRKILFQIYLK